MIKNSFCFMEKIGPRKERAIWKQGVKDWADFIARKKIKGIAPAKKGYYDRQLRLAAAALAKEDSSHFKGKEAWRLYDHFRESCGFLDVEIDSYGRIIVVGISDYYTTKHFVKGLILERKLLQVELQKYTLLATYNGSAFDLPKLRKQFDIVTEVPHLDLKPLCQSIGYRGGLKEIEKILNLKRPPHLRGHPVELWKAFQASGDREYLDLLLAYNAEDIENLKQILDLVYAKKAALLRQIQNI